jgi:heat shock protein HslJ
VRQRQSVISVPISIVVTQRDLAHLLYPVTSDDFQVIHAPELTYQITFDDARVSARIDCNTCNGSFTMAGASLMVGSTLACTRAACTYQASDNHIMTILPGGHELSESVYASGDGVLRPQMTLRSSRGTMMLRQQ